LTLPPEAAAPPTPNFRYTRVMACPGLVRAGDEVQRCVGDFIMPAADCYLACDCTVERRITRQINLLIGAVLLHVTSVSGVNKSTFEPRLDPSSESWIKDKVG
jgi:hypothetical protein